MPARQQGGSLLRVAVATLTLASVSQPAAALSLGESEVRSSLGQPLRVDLAIESDPHIGGLPEARLVDAEGVETWTVQGAGLGSVRLEVEAIDDVRQRLRIRSTQPVWEPLITLRIEVTQASTRIVRELPVLIDPPSAQEPTPESAIAEAIDTRRVEPLQMTSNLSEVAVATAAPEPAVEVAAAPAPPPKRRSAPQPRKAAPVEMAPEPLPRFTMTTSLSTESLAWLEVHPSPRAAPPPEPTDVANVEEGTEKAPAVAAIEEAPPIQTAAAGVAKALTVMPAASASMLSGMETRLTTTDLASLPAAERGLPMGSPWRVFGAMAAFAILLFIYARRMRKHLTLHPPPLAA